VTSVNTLQRERIRSVVRDLACELNPACPLDSLQDSAHLEYDLGLGSLERLELLRRLEQALQRSLSGEVVLQARLCSDLYQISEGPSLEGQLPAISLDSPRAMKTPDSAHTLGQMLQHQAEACSDHQAIHWLSEGQPKATRSYAQLWQEARCVAAGLAALQVQSGQRVGIMLPTGTDFLATLFGTWLLGAVPVPLYPPFRPDQVEEHVRRQAAILRSAGIEVLVIFNEIRPAARLLQLATPGLRHLPCVADLLQHGQTDPRPQSPQQLALIQYTSGSTGHPKGVMLSHSNLLANIRAFRRSLELRPGDVCVTWLPLYHDMGLIGTLLGGIYHGIPIVMMGPQDFLARPSRWLWAIHQYRGTISAAPNFAYDLCAQKIAEKETEGLDLSSWRVALNGAETVRPETLRRFHNRFRDHGLRAETVIPVYGLAEATLAVTFPPLGREPVVDCVNRAKFEEEGRAWPGDHNQPGECLHFVSCGRPLEGIEVQIVEGADRRLDDRRVGRVQFRSPAALQGYFHDPQATGQTLRPGGWVETGDRGYLADGELYLVGRFKNVILKAGRNLHAEDVEEASYEVLGVRRGCSAAFALPDPDSGTEQLVLVVETRHDQHQELENALRRRLQEVLGVTPDRVVVVPPHSVPKTPSGKIRRPLCRQLLLEGRLGQRRGVLAQALTVLGESLRRRMGLLVAWPGQLLGAARWYVPLVTLGLGLLLLGRLHSALARRLASRCCRWLLTWAGVELKASGLPALAGPCLVVANHTSRFDPLLLMSVWPQPLRFVVAPWVAQGALKPLMEGLGAVAVRRGSAAQSRDEVERLMAVFQGGNSLAAFPEGGLEHAPGLRPFTLGVFLAAARAGIPVVAVALQGARELMPDRRFLPRRGRVTLTFSEPLQAGSGDWSEAVELARRARQFIAEHCGEPLCEYRLRRED